MKNKLFIYVLFATMISGGVYAQQINLPEYPEEDGGGGGGTSCTVTSNCYMALGQVIAGSVSCTGTNCERGYEYVICDGIRTEC